MGQSISAVCICERFLLAPCCRPCWNVLNLKMAEISDEQLEELKSGFDMFDLLRGLGLNPLTSEVDKVLKDSELEGKEVDFPTFVTIYDQFMKRPTHANFADMMEAFKTMDRESNGKCFSGELKMVLENI